MSKREDGGTSSGFAIMVAAMLNTPSPRRKRQRTWNASRKEVHTTETSSDAVTAEPVVEEEAAKSGSAPTSFLGSSDRSPDDSLEATFSDGVIDISSQEHEDVREVTGAEGRADVFEQPSALVR